uniref:Uncharacterized protein n=1 Tax=Salix viminalis TaxID=40686 RepID=A0A6N2LCC0_SALVM
MSWENLQSNAQTPSQIVRKDRCSLELFSAVGRGTGAIDARKPMMCSTGTRLRKIHIGEAKTQLPSAESKAGTKLTSSRASEAKTQLPSAESKTLRLPSTFLDSQSYQEVAWQEAETGGFGGRCSLLEIKMGAMQIFDVRDKLVRKEGAGSFCPCCGGPVMAMDYDSHLYFCFIPVSRKNKRKLSCVVCSRRLVPAK